MCMEDLCSYDTTTTTTTTMHTDTTSSSSFSSSSPRYQTFLRIQDEQQHHDQEQHQGTTIESTEFSSRHTDACDLLPDCMTKNPTYKSNSNLETDSMNDKDTSWMMRKSSNSSSSVGDTYGIPGYLTPEEYQIFKKFRSTVYQLGGDFRATVFSFEVAQEEEEFALCRWLRANKFHLDDTLRHVQDAVELSSEARKHNFYPDPAKDALGVHPSIYIDHYPQFNHGRAKNGSPIFVSKPGALNFPALACITTPQGIIRYHWWLQIRDLGQQFLQSYQQSTSTTTRFRRYETLNIMDLDNLNSSIFSSSKYPLQLIRTKSNIDQICFPETLDRMIIINAPVFFTFTWRVIRGFIDPRNANKVELYGKSDGERDKWRARLEELIDYEHIPIQYRDPKSIPDITSLPSTDVPDPEYKDVIRRASYFLNVRTDPSTPGLLLEPGAILHVSVYTRSRSGGYIQIYHSTSPSTSTSKSSQLVHQILVEHKGDGSMEETPTCIPLTPDQHFHGNALDTPGIYTITVIPSGSKCDGPMSDDFVIAIRVCPIIQNVSSVVMNGTCMKTGKSRKDVKKQDLELISPNQSYRIRSKGEIHLFRTPDDYFVLENESLEVELSKNSIISGESRQKKVRRWKSSRYFCGI